MSTQADSTLANTRREALERVCKERHRLSADLREVEAVDDWLGSRYHIRRPLSADEFAHALHALSGPIATRLRDVFDARNAVYSRNAPGRARERSDMALYEAFVDQPYCGLLHSMKRAYILDELVALGTLVNLLAIAGPVLDAGCNIGYHAGWMASRHKLVVTGVDRSKPAVASARRLVQDLSPDVPTFVTADAAVYVREQSDQFDLIYSFDGPPNSAELLQVYAKHLRRGGVLALADPGLLAWLAPSNDTLQRLSALGLQCALSDVVGGWFGDKYEGLTMLVFVKCDDASEPIPEVRNCDAAWNEGGFADYANAASTAPERKTQAYFRATARQRTVG